MGGGALADKRRVLVIGGGFSGILAARDLSHKFHVTVVDCKEFFEYTPGILRAFVKPAHFDNLSFSELFFLIIISSCSSSNDYMYMSP